jgi:hypothetical protein
MVAALGVFGDALGWTKDDLIAPILTGLFVGGALRSSAIRGEVNAHRERAQNLNTDLARWVADRDRVLTAQIYRALGLAKQGVIEDAIPAPMPDEPEGKTQPGSQADTGAFLGRVERIMRQVLHEYRDQASGSVRTYRAMAYGESWPHSWSRRWHSEREPVALRLSDTARATLASWRQREVPVHGTPTVSVKDDPTQAADAEDIRPLEDDAGLLWLDAKREPGQE